ncbi:MAG: Rrf2 family transcriptional regulator [SAR86 cluster bacterium]|jgi:Rrf2 family iron-sulfur cluster assembly transcriptional regulator|nr:RrF2 family transcriptional regulator [Gammaproteobacteria bacterium]MDC3228518.1 RrF2 family transcriptional regulator [Gammaproteobacteria bacterium]MDG1062467.1 Rrf2 family transcriptional regulator [SAR86 cluster bacterium]MDG1960812.1 Rrf2 family transcriptional regulator [SAR86 cluster bacterium]|tara:strand:- start:191 stop:628 length:438 start_codon:yes stop_codon:yes gene_type:complete
MNFTTKSRYAVNALADLEYLSNYENPVTLKDIAARQGIDLTYLEQLFRKLRIAGIVKSVRGRNGGYVYASHPKNISIKNIMDAVEENLDATKCAGTSSCHSGQQCNSHKLWDDLNNVVDEFLSDISITDLVDKPKDPHIILKEIK